jgi:1-deoxy-D-xylulose-5-phosphate synthase
MVIMSPKDENELQHMLATAVQYSREKRGPIALRYPRGNGVGVTLDATPTPLEIGRGEVLRSARNSCDLLLLCFGPITQTGLQVARRIESELGLEVTVVNSRFVKPLDSELLSQEIPIHALVCTLEDHALMGGFGSAVLELISDEALEMQQPLQRFGIGDTFVPHASQSEQHAMHGIDADSIFAALAQQLSLRKAAGFK